MLIVGTNIFFAHDLVKAVSPQIIVELGVHYDDSTLHFASKRESS